MFKTNKTFKKTAILFFVLFFIISGILGGSSLVKAQLPTSETASIPETTTNILDKLKDIKDKLFSEVGTKLLNNVLRNTLNRLAYDAADAITSGADGQKPLFLTKNIGDYLEDYGDAAAGDFLDQLNNLSGMNLCEPNLDVKARIGLGLKDTKRPPEPSCKASTMVKSWEDEVQKFQDMTSKDFAQRYISYFKPESNDLGITVSLFQGMQQVEEKEIEKEEKSIDEDGFKDKETLGGQKEEIPGQSKRNFEEAQKRMSENITTCEGNAFVCAAQVFLNRLAINGFEKAMEIAFSPDEQDPLDDFNPYDLADPDSDPATVYHSGQAKLTQILEPRFNERADYDILSELSTCPQTGITGQNFVPSPNNCVIDDSFSDAISEQKTVGEAMEEGYLHKDWRFTGLNEKTSYNEAYNYRSILILKKYRIVPTGWEEAIYRANIHQAATLEDLVSCFSPDDKYNTFSQGFSPNQEWCKDLIDPKWVLKAPANYCAKEGYGNIINKEITEGQEFEEDEGEDIASNIYVTRADDYCADEQSCIKEKSDGTCEAYGYCTEEKRTWNFGQDSCEPVYNTCQTFKDVSTGKSISYLENTLDYGDCNADSAGCRLYSFSGPYNVDRDKVDWKAYNDIYLNSNAETCASSDEGCDKLIRIQPSYGHNFVKNGNFEETNANLSLWSCDETCLVDDSYSGSKAIDLSNTNNTISVEVGPQLYNISGKTYTFSFYAKDCFEEDDFGFVDGRYNILGDSDEWQYYRLSYTYPANQYLGNTVDLEINSSTCLVDDVKLELGDRGTNYSNYGDNNVVYQKMLPGYLWNDCYENPYSGNLDFSLRADAPDICSDDFSRLCNADEAGCMIYTNAEDRDDQVVAQTSAQDYCQEECNNYDLYIATEDYFNSTQGSKFIPETANECSATDKGCVEFTNLDVLNSGGEAKEYYTSLKQCIKPSENDCATFYVWQGSNQGGYQLESYTLKKDDNNNEPAVVEDDSSVCNENIYNLPVTDPAYNTDCYQFYNTEGEVSYHLYSKTITCSEDCHPYRMSKKNIDTNIENSADCNDLGEAGNWDASTDTCYFCKNGGTWSDEYSSCIYQAIPGQGETCSQEASGCREYNGNSGNNVKIVKAFDFANSLQGWTGKCGDAAELSTEALGRNDHSLWYNEDGGTSNCESATSMIINKAQAANIEKRIEVELGSYNLNRDSAYNLKFTAKVNTATDLDIYFENDSDDRAYFEITGSEDDNSVTLNGDNEWHQYELSLKSLDHRLSVNEALVISSDNSFYLDNVILREIVDRHYLIENSWQTPNVCYYDALGEYQGADYNLGCSAYNTIDGGTEYLRSFTSLCQESAVGCQLMANTYNTKDYKESIYNDTDANNICDADEEDCFTISADEYIFAVYNPDNSCTSDDKGCQRLGETVSYGQSNLFEDVYLRNDPDKYSTILCSEDTANCQAYTSDTGENVYFKDPGNKLCEWREGDDNEWAWYKKDVNKCDANNNGVAGDIESACQSADDCSVPKQLLEAVGSSDVCSSNEDCRLNFCNEMTNKCSLSGNTCSDDDSCPNTNSCIDDRCVYDCVAPEEDFVCPVDPFKTIGYGGSGNQIKQPTDSWVGVCESTSSTCTEFIDPVSDYAVNEVANPSFADLNGDGENGDKWIEGSDVYQNVNLIANRAYIFAANNVSGSIEPNLVCSSTIQFLNGYDNEFSEDNTVYLGEDMGGGNNRYLLIVSTEDQSCQLNRGSASYDPESNFEIIFKEAIIDYQIAKNLDTETCNGKVDLENGCILFNQRDQNGSDGLRSLTYTAYDSYMSASRSPIITDHYNNSNALIKVSPNRVCNTWLACQTKYVNENGDTICYDVADCDALDKDGECANFLPNPEGAHAFDTARDKNSSGYSVLNKYFVSSMSETGIAPQAGSFNFEGSSSAWGETDDSIIVNEPSPLNPEEQFNASYPAEGKAFLKSKATKEVSSEAITVARNQQYYINYLLNTNNLTLGKKARISILEVDANGETSTLVSWQDRTNQWERKVYGFRPVNTDNIKIQISSNDNDNNKYVYIDDISIEPVLEVNDLGESEDKYVSKSCRLYPKQDSLSCTSKDANVIANGWQGYCLQKDPYYPDVCLMWYPVDTISTFTNKDSGYQGKTPLYYCSQADGDFVLMEKRKVQLEITDTNPQCVAGYTGDSNKCKTHIFAVNDVSNSPYKRLSIFIPDSRHSSSTGNLSCGTGSSDGIVFYAYVPENAENVTINNTCRNGSDDYYTGNIEGLPNSYGHSNTEEVFENYLEECAPNQNIGCENGFDIVVDYNIGWYKYNDNLEYREAERFPDGDDDPVFKIYDYANQDMDSLDTYGVRCNQFDKVVNVDGQNKSWAVRSQTSSASTPLFFDPYDSILQEYIYNRADQPFGSAIISSDAFDEGGIYFKNKYFDEESNKDSYAGIPYGCTDNDNEGNCENIGYCNNNPEYTCIIAGGSGADGADKANEVQCGETGVCMPYFVNIGADSSYVCSDSGENCILQCEGSGECNVFNDELNRYVCSGDEFEICWPQCDDGEGGICVEDDGEVPEIPVDGEDILRLIFLKSYATMIFNPDGWTATDGYDYSFTATEEDDVTPICEETQLDENGYRLEGEHCAIAPDITNIALYKGDTKMLDTGNNGFVINESGRYDLKFNSVIDSEQLPLYNIIVSWGDSENSVDVITDQDHRPDEDFPHVISHNYIGIEGEQSVYIKIKIDDNWGYNRCCMGDRNCGYYPPDANECPAICPVCD